MHARHSLYSHSFLPPRLLFDEFIADDDFFFSSSFPSVVGGGESGHRLREGERRAGSVNSVRLFPPFMFLFCASD